MKPKDPSLHVFRDLIEEHRDRYSVTYQPADARSMIAVVSLFFPEVPRDRTVVTRAMEEELEFWLKRFPVPVQVTAYNSRKRLIRVAPNNSECHLTGYVRLFDEAVVRRWGILEEREIPAEACEPEHLEMAYAKVKFRVREEVRALERLEFRAKAKAIGWTVFLMLLFPLFLQAVLHWGRDLVIYLVVCSFLVGAYKWAGIMGLRKPNRFERLKAERIGKREHYFYHCEKNPAAFARLEKENFKREVSQETKRAKQLLQEATERRKTARPSWLVFPRLFARKAVRETV